MSGYFASQLIPGINLPVLLGNTNVFIIACRGFEFAPLVSTILIIFRLCQLMRDIHKFPVNRWTLQTLIRISVPLLAIPLFFYYMYYLLHFYVSFMDVCAQTARYYLMPLLSLSYAFFLHTYPIEQYVPPIFGVPTTLPCTAPHKRELARLQAMIDNENQNNPNGERKTIDLSQSDLIKNCYFCAYKAKYELQGFVRHYAGCGFDYGNLPIPVNNKKD